jgi:hypothetical protein
MPSWWEKKSDELFDKIVVPMIESPTIFGIPNYLDDETRKKFLKFSRWLTHTALNLSIFISFSLIVAYTYKKIGFEKTMLYLVMLCFIQLIFINSHLSDANENRKTL